MININLTGNTTIAYANKTLTIKNGKIEANDYGEVVQMLYLIHLKLLPLR